ncbi:MAG TPA: response regulator transcription factor [Terriglobia bacterium]|nr:response regulator transcription factor [Terriglobia bacterium]
MKILIAEDDAVSRRALEGALKPCGCDLVVAADGAEAWEMLRAPDAPRLAVLDWMMPRLDGLELVRKVREHSPASLAYLIMLTCRDSRADLIQGLGAGADDYVTKPFHTDELRARVQVGLRVVQLQSALDARVRELEEALSRVKRLQGLLPICSYCKKIRDDGNYWQQVEAYITERSEAEFSHGICPGCFAQFVEPELARLQAEG